MPNGKYILNDLEFENQIKGMGDRELMEYTARLSYSTTIRCSNLEGQNHKRLGITGGAGALLGASVAGIIDYFIKRGG